MKNYCISLFLILVFCLNNSACALNNDVISKLEYNFFKTNYTKEKISNRLSRLEKYIYDQTYNHLPLNERISRINNFYSRCQYDIGSSVALSHLSNKSIENNNQGKFINVNRGPNYPYYQGYYQPNTQYGNYYQQHAQQPIQQYQFQPPRNALNNNQAQEQSVPLAGERVVDPVGYPIIDEMESRLFGRSFTSEDIYIRLNRLENTIFGKVSDLPLSDRVDKLRAAVLGDYVQDDSYSLSSASNINENILANSNSSLSAKELIAEYEKQYLGSTFANDSIDARLSRIESKIFGSYSNSYTPEERIQRIATVAEAQESDSLYEDAAELRKYDQLAKGATVAAFVIMLLQGLF